MADYLVHFNQNHDKKGRFTYGDGDGDGITNDHANQRRDGGLRRVATGYTNMRDAHRSSVIERETYKTNRDNLRLRQDQIANQRNKETSSIKVRNEDVKTQKAQAAAERDKIKNARAEEKKRAAIEKEQQRRALQEQKAATAEAKAKAALAKKQRDAEIKAEKDLLRLEKEQRKADKQAEKEYKQAEKDARKFQKEQEKYANRQQEVYARQIQQGQQRAGAFVAAASGRPFTAATLAAGSIGPKNTAGALLGAQALRLLPLGGIAANAATAAIVGKSISDSKKAKAAQQAQQYYYNY